MELTKYYQKDYQEALKYFEIATELNPTPALVWKAGLCYVNLCKYEDAQKYHEKALETEVRAKISINNFEKGYKYFLHQPQLLAAYISYAECFLRTGKYLEAIELLETYFRGKESLYV
jgi:tetratricopeptide (TPR) repeat protein